MTKRHLESIAAIIASERAMTRREGKNGVYAVACQDTVARRLADYFATDNGRFDRRRFLRACGVEE